MTHHNDAAQPVTFTTKNLLDIFTILAAMNQIIAREQHAWPQETRDAVAKAYSLVTFGVDGSCHIADGTRFAVNLNMPVPSTDNGGN